MSAPHKNEGRVINTRPRITFNGQWTIKVTATTILLPGPGRSRSRVCCLETLLLLYVSLLQLLRLLLVLLLQLLRLGLGRFLFCQLLVVLVLLLLKFLPFLLLFCV